MPAAPPTPDVLVHLPASGAPLPPALLARLAARQHALPLLRRLRFAARVAGATTEHARVLYCGGGFSAATEEQEGGEARAGEDGAPFAAAYLDVSRAPETQLWLYASLEDAAPAETEEAAECAWRVLREVRRQHGAYAAGADGPAAVLAGSLGEALRAALATRGAVFARVGLYDKWLLRARGLPPPAAAPPGLRWGPVRRRDVPLMLARTSIPRQERTVVLLPSLALFREDDGEPVAWALLGPDSSLSNLHVEPAYRGQGLAKAVAAKLLRDRLRDYGAAADDGYDEYDDYCWADVAPDNPGSQAVCRSLGGRIGWSVSW
ncbi:hypothetical protein GGS23DRAFT_615149 [Durotheca rogersii]|uniref:uncharacterized protein n=1 Tax=Durotheca rogersii TaxID=419775 RepID=UPI002220CE6D|nr:uncharacterized protein GGS23DRAFT_615149 [Durotheca rogersii]KAI5866593.1 hypothetical protein GGS23DRAFT_615149 [Durotheca rogersii]